MFAEPSVSTAARWRTMAFLFAMRCTPSESTAVTTAGRPSGTAATASATPRMSTSKMAEKPAHILDEDDRRDHHDGDDDDDQPEQLADTVEFLLQRRGLVRRLLQHAGDAPHLGLHPGRRDDRAPAPIGRRRAAEDHVVTVAEPRLFRDRSDILRHRQAFARERRFCRLQRGGLDQPRVGRNGVAFFDENDVAGHELGRRDALSGAVSDDIGVRRRHLAQRRHCLLRAGLLDVAHERVEKHDGEDRDGFVGQGGVALIEPQARRRSAAATSSRTTRTSVNWPEISAMRVLAFPPPARSCRIVRAAPAPDSGSGRTVHRTERGQNIVDGLPIRLQLLGSKNSLCMFKRPNPARSRCRTRETYAPPGDGRNSSLETMLTHFAR